MTERARQTISLARINDGQDGAPGLPGRDGQPGEPGRSISSITRLYKLSESPPTFDASEPTAEELEDWQTTEPESEELYEYRQLEEAAEGEGVPSFDSGEYYAIVDSEYTLLEEEPSDWSTGYTGYFERVLTDKVLYYLDRYTWSDGEVAYSDVSVSGTYTALRLAIELDNITSKNTQETAELRLVIGDYHEQYINVPTDQIAPVFEVDKYYQFVSNEYVLLEEEPSDWAEGYTEYFITKPFSNILAQTEHITQNLTDVISNADSMSARIEAAEGNITDIEATASEALARANQNTDELNNYKGFIEVVPEGQNPYISVGKRTIVNVNGENRTEVPWETKVEHNAVRINSNGSPIGSFCVDEESKLSIMNVENAKLSSIMLRAVGQSEGKLGIVAQTSGHVSLKEI